ncbi:hypothetical protein B0H14DRAFT_3517119 [Mycena olivaceomarginata]|nr:hypothetical protein B0H14DRAFT_3517119 [Mycena olivaceomarginata]
MSLAWRANIDIKPVMSKDAALNYITKYTTKAEQQAPGFPEILAELSSRWQIMEQHNWFRTSASFQTLMLDEEEGMRELEDANDEENSAMDNINMDQGSRRVTGDSWF